MQLLENPWIFNIPLIDTPDDIDECEECGRSESLFYVTKLSREYKGCKSCVSEIDAYDDQICTVCGSKTCLSFYQTEDEEIFGCDNCVSLVEPIDWYWEKKLN